ncbi:MAG: AAA family ATPase [Hydrogenophaga sp.]|uniref:AAA family ATPase n=1 Tax=Hydrogenophaga sp. TaxID=1904254 RepID=UPI00274A793C|nr:AAA family ATPase [Hydrogenophaga sp.]MDP2419247.1 AAA family ATPase [Hydrogenophaga sp.]MDZ4188880.1 AAA family ATPase [Hydrogenophaga sp.]
MSLTHHNVSQVWDPLRAKKPQLKQFLESVRVCNLRGISNLRINLGYPVTVVAGTNGSGKSTVLLACACAYDVPGVRGYSPAVLFPNLTAEVSRIVATITAQIDTLIAYRKSLIHDA